jgi:hypothetical protein
MCGAVEETLEHPFLKRLLGNHGRAVTADVFGLSNWIDPDQDERVFTGCDNI